jgi:hypothetical protein
LRGLLRLPKGTARLLGILLLVTGALFAVVLIAGGIIAARTSYFEQRNLRELDRIAAELTSTRESLAQAATLHFVPQQLHFSLSDQLECLSATTALLGARRQPISITYYFTEPGGSGRIARWHAEQVLSRQQTGSREEPQVTENSPLPEHICAYQRPRGEPLERRTALDGTRLKVEMTVRLANLLWPMAMALPEGAAAQSRETGDLARCRSNPTGAASPSTATNLRGFIRDCFRRAAVEDMRDRSYSHRGDATIEQTIDDSLNAAFDGDAIRINASTPVDALDLDASLRLFDAVQIISTDARGQSTVLVQAGRLPATVERSAGSNDSLVALLGLEPAATASAPAPAPVAQANRTDSVLGETRIVQDANLVVFQRTVNGLAGLDCSPCRIVGAVDRDRFNGEVRRMDGVQVTIFLIGVLTLIAIIPLVQLKLRRRLDAAGWIGQYLLWFSLTLLAASAVIASLAIWTSQASRNAGAAYARDAIGRIGEAFQTELTQSLVLISRRASQLPRSDTIFPAPAVAPAELDPPVDRHGRALAGGDKDVADAAIFDTIGFYRRDGFLARDTARIADTHWPSFGLWIGDRPYFLRLTSDDTLSADLPCFAGVQARTRFILDRVFARPDGALKVVFILPMKQGCLGEYQPATEAQARQIPASGTRPAPGAAAPSTAASPPAATAGATDFYDPTENGALVGSATLRTFLRVQLAPGFSYAVIDPRRGRGQANVLYHSNHRAELVERLQNEIDDPARFDSLVAQALEQRSDGQRRALRMDTNYQARPARLTVSYLSPNTDWILVIIEDRNDAGFAIWRAATFGYMIWLIGALVVGVTLAIARLRRSRALDRRPGLSLWPRERLVSFTPPRLERQARRRDALGRAAALRDRHIGCAFLGALCGLPAAEGAARILFACATVIAVLASRTYFEGRTAIDDRAAAKSGHRVIGLGLALLAMAGLVCAVAMFHDYNFRGMTHLRQGFFDWIIKLRLVFYVIGTVLLLRCLLASRAALRSWANGAKQEPAAAADARPGRIRRWFSGWKESTSRRDFGWILALALMGAAPAAAGFLDSYDQDTFLLAERMADHDRAAVEERTQALDALEIAAPSGLSDAARTAILTEPLAPETDAVRLGLEQPGERAGLDQCYSMSCFAIYYVGLHEQALQYSDFVSFTLTDAFRPSLGAAKLIMVPILIVLPPFLVLLCLLFFKHQYFPHPPSLPLGKDPEFDPPLSFTRAEFIETALLPAAKGEAPAMPFPPAGFGHVILGVGMDLRHDFAPGKETRLQDNKNIIWVDLADPAPVPAGGKAIVIGNLDLVLQTRGPEAAAAYSTIKSIVDAEDHRHIFLLADIDPLDRIAMLWGPGSDDDAEARAGERPAAWRWAQLIEDFTLFPIRPAGDIPCDPGEPRVLRLIREELGVLETSFACELQQQLLSRLRAAIADGSYDYGTEPERILSFIAEQMSDHYNKLWASSSDEERVMLYHVARDYHLKMKDSRALRSLLTRGLVVRMPEYRLMNRSFAIYVCRLGATSAIRESAKRVGGLDSVWPVIRYPLAAIAAAGVILLQFVAPSAASGAIGTLPALLALIPSLLGRWFQDKAVVG